MDLHLKNQMERRCANCRFRREDYDGSRCSQLGDAARYRDAEMPIVRPWIMIEAINFRVCDLHKFKGEA